MKTFQNLQIPKNMPKSNSREILSALIESIVALKSEVALLQKEIHLLQKRYDVDSFIHVELNDPSIIISKETKDNLDKFVVAIKKNNSLSDLKDDDFV